MTIGTEAATSLTMEQATNENVLHVTQTTASVSEVQGVVYKQVLGHNLSGASAQALHLDLLLPDTGDGSPKPLVVFVPGGALVDSDPQACLTQRMAFAGAGYVVASVETRTVPHCRYPAPIEDVKAAIRWLRAHARDYGIDEGRVGCAGTSGAGYLAVMVGVTGNDRSFDVGENLQHSSAVDCVIDLYGVSDPAITCAGLPPAYLAAQRSPATAPALLINGLAFSRNAGAALQDTPEATAQASPFSYLDASAPPFLILHGSEDRIVSPIATMELHNRLRAVGVASTRYVVAGAGHGGPLFDQPEVLRIMVDFLDEHLK